MRTSISSPETVFVYNRIQYMFKMNLMSHSNWNPKLPHPYKNVNRKKSIHFVEHLLSKC